jgi:hypothetical protein
VQIFTLRSFFHAYLNFDLDHDIAPADWLTFPQQKLRAVTAGSVFRDDVGLQAMRDRFAWYPRDVWLYLLAAGWARIGEEDHLMGRAGWIGDELGSALITSRLIRDLMQLCFLMERQYAPYPKWFGAAFGQLSCAYELSPLLRRIQLIETWREREAHLVSACERVANMHNALNITDVVPVRVSSFYSRPFQVINSGQFVDTILASIQDEQVKSIASQRLIGSIDQFSDSTDLREDTERRMALRQLYA